MSEMIVTVFTIGLLAGIVIGLIVARFIPQKIDIGIGIMPIKAPDDDDASEAWKGKS